MPVRGDHAIDTMESHFKLSVTLRSGGVPNHPACCCVMSHADDGEITEDGDYRPTYATDREMERATEKAARSSTPVLKSQGHTLDPTQPHAPTYSAALHERSIKHRTSQKMRAGKVLFG